MRQTVDFAICFSPITRTLLPNPRTIFQMDKENDLGPQYVQKYEFSDFCMPEIPLWIQLFYLFANEIRRCVI
jgi:hypothetical protein